MCHRRQHSLCMYSLPLRSASSPTQAAQINIVCELGIKCGCFASTRTIDQLAERHKIVRRGDEVRGILRTAAAEVCRQCDGGQQPHDHHQRQNPSQNAFFHLHFLLLLWSDAPFLTKSHCLWEAQRHARRAPCDKKICAAMPLHRLIPFGQPAADVAQRLARSNVSDLSQTGFTVTFSRGFAPHSAAGWLSPRQDRADMKFSVVILARAAAKSKPCAAFICRKPAPDAAGAGSKA